MADRWFAKQPRAMGHQVAQSDRLIERVLRVKIRQIFGDRFIEIEDSLLDQLHHREVGKQLGHGADAVNGRGGGWDLGLRVAEAESRRPDDLLIVHQGDRKGGQLLLLHFAADKCVDRLDGRDVFRRRIDPLLCDGGGRQPSEDDGDYQ